MSKLAGKTILITGATGLIGSHIVNTLMEMADVQVIALGRNADKIKRCFSKFLDNSKFKYIEHDVSLPLNTLEETVDYIFHAAGPMENKIIINKPLNVINPNIYGIKNCLEYLRQQETEKKIKGRIVVFSSVTVYGNVSEEDIVVNECDTAVTEAIETIGATYSESKRISEVIARAYKRQFDTDVIIARFSTVYGNTCFIPDTAFFEFLKKATLGDDILISSSGAKKRDNIYIDDAIKALIYLIEKGESGEVYNISSNGELGNFAAIDEIANIIAEVANEKFNRTVYKEVKVLYKEALFKKREAGVIMNNNKLKSLGWSLETDLRSGIKKTIDAYYQQITNLRL